MALAPMHSNVVGDFVIGSEIGRGSFATVYRGQRQSTRQPVAIKSVLRSKLTKKLLENLEGEISILKAIKHEHIVELIDCQKTSTHIHLVMEYCSLGDLSYFIKKRDKFAVIPATAIIPRLYPNTAHGGLNEYLVRHFLQQLASALKFLRDHDLMHRDLKPQNLLLQAPDPNYTPDDGHPYPGSPDLPILKIADFGFARSLPSTSMAETLCGSPLYMAPEILRYEKYDATADLWSVGTVTYEMITGRPPFKAQNHVELLRKIEKAADVLKFPELVENDPDIASDSLKNLVRSLLIRDPKRRLSYEGLFNHPCVAEPLTPRTTATTTSHYGVPPKPIPRRLSMDNNHIQSTPPAAHVAPASGHPQPTPSFESGSPKFIRDYLANADSGKQSSPERTGFIPSPLSRQQLNRLPSPLGQGQPITSPPISPLSRQSSFPSESGGSEPSTGTGWNSRRIMAPSSQKTKPRLSPLTPVGTNTVVSTSPSPPPTGIEYHRQGFGQNSRDRLTHPTQHPRKSPSESDVSNSGSRTSLSENDYVMVDKRNVEINALADELAASPRVYPSPSTLPSGGPNALIQRSRSQGLGGVIQRTFAGAIGVSPLKSDQMRSISQPIVSQPQRALSPKYIKAGGTPSSTSPSGALARAISLAGVTLFGSPPRSLPRHLSPQPQSPLIRAVVGSNDLAEERLIKEIEEIIRRSNSVFLFAETKFSQIEPHKMTSETQEGRDDISAQLLTREALEDLCDEAILLYLKSLSLLQRAMEITGSFWREKQGSKVVSQQLNSAVQWIRQRFNDCLDRAEIARSIAGNPEDGVARSEVSAEKLLYDRALEISRAAAVDELVGENLIECEQSYQTAIDMLEAILEPPSKMWVAETTEGDHASAEDNSIDDEDKEMIRIFVSHISKRLRSLEKKAGGRRVIEATKISPSGVTAFTNMEGDERASHNEETRKPTSSDDGTTALA